jgi:hypothetical protein
MKGSHQKMDFHAIPLRAVFHYSADDTDEVTSLPFYILDAGLEVTQFYRQRVVGI